MKRLTEKHYGANDYYMTCSAECERDQCVECAELEKIVNLLGAYEDTGLTPAEMRSMKMDMAIVRAMFQGAEVERLKELAVADREGHVVMLPCKVGGEVYSTLDDFGRLHQCRATYVHLDERPYLNIVALEPVDYEGSQYGITFGSFGKTAFLTRKEAEEALRRAENG